MAGLRIQRTGRGFAKRSMQRLGLHEATSKQTNLGAELCRRPTWLRCVEASAEDHPDDIGSVFAMALRNHRHP
ncbi:hypothetical protein NDU88_007910 [Pleurodeles waltl]|uniref:Uncharacterized protein n=1 Tax=Pleurodeles waltl TaxID=8319 RepID=A0AAV7NXP2_PLEWA|nr:hypothetical protein NDU88_007910 [Pleurodeles waltl]